MALVDDATQLHLDSLIAVRGYQGRDAAAAEVHAFRRRLLEHATEVRSHYAAGRLRAVVVVSPDPDPWTRSALTHVLLDAEPAYVPWVIHTLRQLGPLPASSYAQVLPHHRPWLPRLAQVGLHPEGCVLLGEPRTALAGLGPGPAHAAFTAQGLDLVPFQAAHVAAAMDLKRQWFGAHPEFGWFLGTDAWLAHEAQAPLDPDALVVLEGQTVVGLLRFDLSTRPMWGRCAGMDLCLAPHLHGRGLAAPAYRLLLPRMVARGAQRFKGGTSQPGVIALGHRMHRWPVAWMLRTARRFDWSHWDDRSDEHGTR